MSIKTFELYSEYSKAAKDEGEELLKVHRERLQYYANYILNPGYPYVTLKSARVNPVKLGLDLTVIYGRRDENLYDPIQEVEFIPWDYLTCDCYAEYVDSIKAKEHKDKKLAEKKEWENKISALKWQIKGLSETLEKAQKSYEKYKDVVD